MKHLFYVPEITNDVVLPKEEAQHCIRVLRLKEGDQITLTDGKGILYNAVLKEIGLKHCRIYVTGQSEQAPLWNFNIQIAMAPTKNMDRTEWFVEKATEIGIDRITFLRCQYSERRQIKLSRLQKIAINAMKQSQKATLPQIDEMADFQGFVTQPFDGQKMIAHCIETKKQLIKSIYQPPGNALIMIGPEGDFSKGEVTTATSLGFEPVSLGNSRLRTETAALTACHTIHILNQ